MTHRTNEEGRRPVACREGDQQPRAGAGPAGVRIGVDLVSVADVAASIHRFGPRYLERVYTVGERAAAEGPPRVRAERLAARFAAKEAAIKVLRPADGAPPWPSIEVRTNPDGSPDIRLHGPAAAMAAAAGLGPWAVSLSHDGGTACAVVVATIGAEGYADA